MNRRHYDKLLDIIQELKELSSEVPVIVEGIKDEKSLRHLGIDGEIFKVQTAASVLEFCDNLAAKYREVVLFTDLDSAGKKIGRNVKKYLTDKGVKINDNIAKRLMYTLDTVEAEKVFKRFEKVYQKFNSP